MSALQREEVYLAYSSGGSRAWHQQWLMSKYFMLDGVIIVGAHVRAISMVKQEARFKGQACSL